jgi:4-amino-4-deoxy-L-arabinose transferase-like glycosyltransferase
MPTPPTFKPILSSVWEGKPNIREVFQPFYAWIAVALLIGVGVARIVLTYPVFSQTYDEPAHIARGMEWLDKGQYTYYLEHPPLAPVMVAMLPYFFGARSSGLPSRFAEGNAILHTGGGYLRNLTLARVGILPLFVLSTLTVWLWAKRDFGWQAALLATGLFTSLPSILAHSGIATTDMAFTATFLLGLFAFRLCLEHPTIQRSILLGITIALSMLAKFSALVFLPVAGGGIILIYWYKTEKSTGFLGYPARQWLGGVAIAVLTGFFVIWGGYRFSVGPVRALPGFLSELQLPAREYIRGIQTVMQHNDEGHLSYLLGYIGQNGWWYYFPVVIAVKTPLPFLALFFTGFIGTIKRIGARRDEAQLLIPVLASFGVLGMAMTSNINIGQRHILPMYPFLAMTAGYGAFYLWTIRGFGQFGRLVTIGLVSWYLASTIAAHPDYLAYFNELAGGHPEDIVVDSNLDWGQDILRLSRTLKQSDIEPAWDCLYSSHGNRDLVALGLPRMKKLPAYKEKTGWIAISVMCLKMGTQQPPYDQFAWLEAYQPIEKVGKTIFLYFIPEGNASSENRTTSRQ